MINMKKLFLSIALCLMVMAFTSCSQSVGDKSSGFLGAPSGGLKGEGAEKIDPPGKIDGEFDAAVKNEIDYEAGAGEDRTGAEIPIIEGTLTAGEWIDNDHYSFWQNLFQKEDTGWERYRRAWERNSYARTFVTVSKNGKPIENSSLTLMNADKKILWRAKTNNEGKAYLFYNAAELSNKDLIVTSDLAGEKKISKEDYAISFNIDEPEAPNMSKSLDLALIVDTTGSMSDELSYLQKELESVIKRTARDNGNIPVRLSLSFYRDDGDEYVLRSFDFNGNIAEAIKNLAAQNADGGGDMPEKVNVALDNAINKISWSDSSTKLMFIILDAPPHSDDKKAVEDMNALTEQAAAKGIRLIPILASGGDKETEFLMRDFALKTSGSFLFLTDHSGVSAGEHIEPTIGAYKVEKLNDLMVSVINRYLKNCDKPAEYKDEKVEIKQEETTAAQKQPVTEEKISMTHLKSVGSGGERKETFLLKNNTFKEYTYSYHFELQRFTEGKWETTAPVNETAFIEIAGYLVSKGSAEFETPIGNIYGELSSGEYRVLIDIYDNNGDKATVSGRFSI